MNWSSFQLAIFDFFQNSCENGFISAVAGSGKTTVIVKGQEYVPTTHNGFSAFNNHIVDSLVGKLPMSTEVFTLNAFGWRALRAAFPRIKLNRFKVDNLLKYKLLTNEKEYEKYRGPVTQMVGLLKSLYADWETVDLDHLCGLYDVEPPDERFHPLVRDAMRLSDQQGTVADFNDQIYMTLKMGVPLRRFGTFMIDESQDLSPAQIEMILRMKNDRVVAVGDENQAIYGFRGANPEAIATLSRQFNMRRLPLSICYRCPKAVVAEAKKIVPEIEAWNEAPQGTVAKITAKTMREGANKDSYVLCRLTSPLITSCLRFIRDGRHATVKGRDIGKMVCGLVSRICPGNVLISEFIPLMQDFRIRELDRLNSLELDTRVTNLEDRLDTIQVVLEDSSCQTTNDLRNKIMSLFSDEHEGVVHSTVHRAKGLEAPTIYILRPDLMPFKRAKQDWQKKQEMNLLYVATTRVLGTKENHGQLFWVPEEKKNAQG